MKHLGFLPLLAALCFASPVTGWTRDRHHHHHHHCYSPYRSAPIISFYRPYSVYSSPYSYYPSYGYYPYASSVYYTPYYSRPSTGFTLSTGPRYTTYSRTVLSNDSDDDLAADVQRALARRGYYDGEIDGDIGPESRAAIRRYQYDRRLEVTGRIDRALLRSLGLS